MHWSLKEKSSSQRNSKLQRPRGLKNLECSKVEGKRNGDLNRASGGGDPEKWPDFRAVLDKENRSSLRENNTYYLLGVTE